MANSPIASSSSVMRHDREASEEAVLSRRLRLRDKMVAQVVKQFRKYYPDLVLDQRSIDVVRHQVSAFACISV